MKAVFGILSLIPTVALAGSITGKVDATPAKYLAETVVYVKEAKATHAAAKVTIDQKGMKFSPHVVAITAGDSVDFLNHDNVDHNVFSPDNEGYNLGMFNANETRNYAFAKPGVYTQLCSVHPEMLAYIFVGQNPHHAVIEADGRFKIDHVPPGTYQVAVWNSKLKAAEQTVTVAEGKAAEVNFSIKR
jgi:plastocyanin